ncbi:MAG: RNA binding S1 domain protein [Parcubacteria group bacterium GW2011_GWD2_43_10]|uniref:S1 motif domain-containing protein n=4 Tax=Candidatus Vebleniibacteriota TaxID=1817921 RepID=A0A1G2Q4V1_9BACT|nr:MAG: RNA binding S1 domain protein [Parcubacteria group bacterium GW2011_GWA2_42_80]KKS77824.1 MAG: RNA binding S1 domain protein [Parcubacteria group bacterium GW2011_GWD1_42_9]KKS81709.1 MAG: RNA binding S1 domain protein [Parcubacteria group bacterium GW2011_GWD2_43_10]KKS93844.1 MAG: RNA binding S1 domain protein [Parcubacteria group bacterium GW2011_GWE2_43_12]KKT13460.1 MAG: RNA binding S1 domain protein [Parcubacteria group bacterium GW2011_GWA1_43_27]KKT15383.1 MAG: RNA binding S1 d
MPKRKKLEPKTNVAMEQLLASGNAPAVPKVGDIIEGVVTNMGKREVRLDIPGFTTGIVRGRELIDESGEYSNLKVGDNVAATVLELENERGELELSFRNAGHQKAWGNLEDLKRKAEIVIVKVMDANKGGLMVKLGQVDGFLPVSQLAVEHYPRVEGGDKNRILELLKQLIGKEMEVKVMTVQEDEEKLIFSERAAWEEKQKDKLDQFKVGDIVEGKISGVVDFGCFVEFGQGLEGLVHISELAWQRIDNPRDVVKSGDKVKAKIINLDGSKISLSFRRLHDDPWKNVDEKYQLNDIVEGKVLKVNPFGVFVELDPEIHGLAHVSELSEKPVKDPTEIVKIGETRQWRIISMDPKEHRLGLSIKALETKPEVTEKETATEATPPAEPSPQTETEAT